MEGVLSDAEDYFPERGSTYYITALTERTVTLHFNVINKSNFNSFTIVTDCQSQYVQQNSALKGFKYQYF
jgi:hypothetical protein